MAETSERDGLHLIDEGNALEQAGQLEQAMQRYEAAIRLVPNLARAHLNRGNILLAMGDTEAAVDAYATALAHNPDYASAHYNTGNAYVHAGRHEAALAAYRAAIALKPDFADAEVAIGCVLEELGQLDAAVASYRRALKIKADYIEVYGNLGHALQKLGQLDDAVATYRKALEIEPDLAMAHYNLGSALQNLGQLNDAVASYGRALEIKPDFVAAQGNLGNVLQHLGQLDSAVASYRRALEINPDYVDAHCNLGTVLQDLGQLDDAVASYRRALEIKPDLVIAHYNLGNALRDLGQLDDAAVSYGRAVEMKPDFTEAHYNLGNTLKDLGQFDGAVASFGRALQINRDYAEAHNNLGNTLKDLGQFDDALASFRRALQINRDYAEAHNNLGNTLKDLGQFEDAVASYRRALEIKPDFAEAHSNLLFALNYSAGHTTPYCLEQARQFGQMLDEKTSSTRLGAWSGLREPMCLRVGMVSGDMRNHPVGYFLEGVLAHIDPRRLELIAYPTSNKVDEITAAIRRHLSAWNPIFDQNDEAASQLIHADAVHILLDLSGHTAQNRLPLFARRLAPVQASWLGYFATTGVAEMDYLLGDAYVTPAEEADHFTERVWRLPDCYLCFTPPKFALEVGPLPALSAGHITFGSFNNLAKMNDAVVALWARVLQAVSGSRLFLKSSELNDLKVREITHQRFADRGITFDRLTLEGSSPRVELLAAYSRVDIALDPFPYPGGTTSVEGLWMGVPVITRRGDRFLSHVGESIAHNASLSDWIAAGDDDYVLRAIKFAANLGYLANLREGLRQKVMASSVFDALRFARHFEAAMWGMWECRQV